jgi:hypothetical protein
MAGVEPRMLERRISNQRQELNNDQQMNYLLSWFVNWSDLEKEDFVPVLAEKMSNKWATVNGICDEFQSIGIEGRPVSLFQCQVALFKGWVSAWSDDQKTYLILRLKDIDQAFSRNYEKYLEYGKDSPERDYFEPGIPPELDLSLDRSTTSSMDPVELSVVGEDSLDCESVNLKDYPTDDDLCKPQALSPIVEDHLSLEVDDD